MSLDAFWATARRSCPALPCELPEAWAFGATPEQADELLALVLDGIKTATASSLQDYRVSGDPLPGRATSRSCWTVPAGRGRCSRRPG